MTPPLPPPLPPKPSWPMLLEHLLAGGDLRGDEAGALMRGWLEERIDPVLTGALLTALRARGVTGEELAAMAAVLREACPLPAPRPSLPLVDTCGTGGDGAGSFNISTATAFVAAACGAHVAKHGNRSASGSVGSADVLATLGVRLQAPLAQVVEALPHAGVTFLFAPGWHPALVGLAPLRRTLGIRTVFNLLGPLVNPLTPEYQVLGVARTELLDPMADALRRLGLVRAVVVHGHGGLDEASLSGPNELRLVENGEVRTEFVDPWELGLTRAGAEELRGGDVATNARILEQVLRGQGSEAQRDVVVLNTALVLWAAGRVESVAEGLGRAAEALDSGAPWRRLDMLRGALAASASGDAGG
jgi:anthranilate phosphoribosyltransferase